MGDDVKITGKRQKLWKTVLATLGVPSAFPFKKKYRTEMQRGWTKFNPRNKHAARVSSYIEHLQYKDSHVLASIIKSVVVSGNMTVSFLQTWCDKFVQRDLNPKKLKAEDYPDYTTPALRGKLKSLEPQDLSDVCLFYFLLFCLFVYLFVDRDMWFVIGKVNNGS